MYVDLKTWLADTYLEKVDKTSMAVSLEARLPLLDYRLVEFAMTIPSSLKIHRGTGKQVLRRPSAIFYLKQRYVSRNMVSPSRQTHGFEENYASSHTRCCKMPGPGSGVTFVRLKSNAYGNSIKQGYEVRDSHLWLLLNFELWARQYLDRRMAA